MTRDRRLLIVVMAAGALVALSACAAPANPHVAQGPDVPGFWLGLWQGLILPITFVVSLFDDTVGIYSTRNSGHLYDLGFVLGAGGLALPGFLSGHRGRR